MFDFCHFSSSFSGFKSILAYGRASLIYLTLGVGDMSPYELLIGRRFLFSSQSLPQIYLCLRRGTVPINGLLGCVFCLQIVGFFYQEACMVWLRSLWLAPWATFQEEGLEHSGDSALLHHG